MEKTYKYQLPKGMEVTSTSVRVENGNVFVDVELKEKFEPKDGDFVVTNNGCIYIYNSNYSGLCKENSSGFYVGVDAFGDIVINDGGVFSRPERLATEQEKSTFLKRIEKELNKKWNPETKKLEDFKPVIRTYQDLIDNDLKIKGYCVIGPSDIISVNGGVFSESNRNVASSEKVAKSMLAMAMISQLMPYYGGEITDEEWNNSTNNKYIIERRFGEIYRDAYCSVNCFLAFHTAKQRDEFLKYNEQLVKDYLMID